MTSKLCHEGQQLCRHVRRRKSLLETSKTVCRMLSTSQCRTHASTTASDTKLERHSQQYTNQLGKSPLGQRAQQKEADREFFADLLSSAATKRDAKAYLTRLKSPAKTKPLHTIDRLPQSGSYVNVGNLFRGSRAAEMSPVFSQSEVAAEFQEQETLHVALVKIQNVAQLSSSILGGVAETLAQLNRLSISPCVVVESDKGQSRAQLSRDVDLLVNALNEFGNVARRVDNIFSSTRNGKVILSQRKLLMRPLRKGQIPVVTTVAYNEDEQMMTTIPIIEAMLALTKELAGLNTQSTENNDHETTAVILRQAQKQVSLDRIITIDSAGGIPNDKAADGRHVFLNLDQEYNIVKLKLQAKIDSPSAITHLANLDLLNQALQLLPSSSSGLMTTNEEAANHGRNTLDTSTSNVGTRRQKNTLIHNLLTDKPAHSASLPLSRLSKANPTPLEHIPAVSHSTFIKRGMPVSIFPNPFEKPWTPTSPRLKLTDSKIDLARLVYLIEDSFNRKLDVEDYLRRVNDRIAGVIIAGDYEGGAILTWETPPGDPSAEPVPYLDKFAVLKRSQGAGGVADIVFNAMVRSCFPNGVCWRSRKDNPVNKWYFERSRGTFKLPNHGFTMFWTTPGMEVQNQKWIEYEAVCRGVQPSWADKNKPAD